jgi:acyl-CoA thioesterase-1
MQSFRRSFFLPGWQAAGPVSPRSYGHFTAPVQIVAWALAAAMVAAVAVAWPAVGAERPVRIVALGDSLTSGVGLAGSAAFPARLEKALRAKGLAVEIANAGVSGDTASGGLARLDWAVPPGTDAVIVELGANDMLRGVDPAVTRAALETIVRRLKARGIEVLLSGMLAAPNLGADFAREFNRIYPELAVAHDLILDPFFVAGVVRDPKLNLNDGLHPSAAGVAVIVNRILPKVEALIARVRARQDK